MWDEWDEEGKCEVSTPYSHSTLCLCNFNAFKPTPTTVTWLFYTIFCTDLLPYSHVAHTSHFCRLTNASRFHSKCRPLNLQRATEVLFMVLSRPLQMVQLLQRPGRSLLGGGLMLEVLMECIHIHSSSSSRFLVQGPVQAQVTSSVWSSLVWNKISQ